MFHFLKRYPKEAVEEARKEIVEEAKKLGFTEEQARFLTRFYDFSYLWKS